MTPRRGLALFHVVGISVALAAPASAVVVSGTLTGSATLKAGSCKKTVTLTGQSFAISFDTVANTWTATQNGSVSLEGTATGKGKSRKLIPDKASLGKLEAGAEAAVNDACGMSVTFSDFRFAAAVAESSKNGAAKLRLVASGRSPSGSNTLSATLSGTVD